MGTGVREALEGYIELAQWWLDEWGDHATTVATRLDTGTYTADAAAADLMTCASLAAESMVLVANEAFDAAAALTGRQDEPHNVTSLEFTAAAPTSPNDPPRRLELKGDLVATLGSDVLPVSCVTFLPDALTGVATRFRMLVNATGHAGVTYLGVVAVSSASGVELEAIQVWISVP